MRAILAFILLLLLQPAPPPFVARWERPGVARLAWIQPAGVRETCMLRAQATGNRGQSRRRDSRLLPVPALLSPVLVHCWPDLPAGLTVYRLGNLGPLDAAYHPAAGDTFVLTMDGAVARAELRSVWRLAIVRR